jgi:protein-tyrosine phosphatase
MTLDHGRRRVRFERLHNVRDLGGLPAGGGRQVAPGRLYRADSLSSLTGADWERFRSLGVRTVIDLRYPWEIEEAGRVPPADGLDFYNLSIEHKAYDQAAIDEDVEPSRFFADRYAEVATDGVGELRRVLELIASDASLPLAFHCKSGKDRTGIVAALTLSLLGVARDDVIDDFGMSNLATPAFHAEHVASGRPLPAWPGFGRAPRQAMRLFLEELDAAYGSVEAYTRERLGVSSRRIEQLRARLLEPVD